MADMRLIVAGAGGRMGRTLVKAITEAKGFALAGALEDARSPLMGWDAGTLAGMPENGVKLTSDAAALMDKADAIIDFTAPVATIAFATLAAKGGKVHIIGTTGFSAAASPTSLTPFSGVPASVPASQPISGERASSSAPASVKPLASAMALTSVRPMRPPAPATIKRISAIG